MDLIQAGSRFLTDTESRYETNILASISTIELEMLAVCWAEIDTNGHPEMILTEIRTLHGDTTESLQLQDIMKHAEEDLKITSYAISSYKDSLPTEVNYQTVLAHT